MATATSPPATGKNGTGPRWRTSTPATASPPSPADGEAGQQRPVARRPVLGVRQRGHGDLAHPAVGQVGRDHHHRRTCSLRDRPSSASTPPAGTSSPASAAAPRGIKSKVKADIPNEVASTAKAAVDAWVVATRAPPRAGPSSEPACTIAVDSPSPAPMNAARYAVAGQHDAEQDRPAVLGELSGSSSTKPYRASARIISKQLIHNGQAHMTVPRVRRPTSRSTGLSSEWARKTIARFSAHPLARARRASSTRPPASW